MPPRETALKRLAMLCLLALGACGPATAPQPKQPPAPAKPAARADDHFQPPITARGNEPFWAMKIARDGMVFSRPAEPDVRYDGSVRSAGAHVATWTAPGVGGPRVTLKVEPCSDGMSDMKYPMSATVEGEGEVLRGCAFRDHEPPAAPG